MKERPILFSAPMVRAILDGRKTQTRRPITSLARLGAVTEVQASSTPGYDVIMRDKRRLWQDFTRAGMIARCPFGVVGDRLWVRETWAPKGNWKPRQHEDGALYAADRADAVRDLPRGMNRWRPSIHMPRWASRITLEVTGVRVERLQDISEDDAKAEGVSGPFDALFTPKVRFEALWESINGLDAWDANPWVWVVEFRRL